MSDIKEMVQVCLEADADFIKTFGTKFTLQPLGSTTAGFSKGGKDFFTTFGSFQVQSKKRMAMVSLVATHDGLQTLELHLDEDDTRDIVIVDSGKLEKPDSVTVTSTRSEAPPPAEAAVVVAKPSLPKAIVKPAVVVVKPLRTKIAACPTTTKPNYNHHHEESSSLATPATSMETAYDDDDPFGSVADDVNPSILEYDENVGAGNHADHHDRADDDTCDSDDSSMRDARCRLMRLNTSQPQPHQAQLASEVEESKEQPPSRPKSRNAGSDIPLEIDTASLEKGQPELTKSSTGKPLDDTYNSDEEDEDDDDEEEEHHCAKEDDDSSNPFISSSEDDLSIPDDDVSSDDDSDKRDVRCQQRRLSVGHNGINFR